MKAKLLLTTAALALAVGVGSPAPAQDGDSVQKHHSAVQKGEPGERTMKRDKHRSETIGQDSTGKNREPQKDEDKTQATQKSGGQIGGDGKNANDNESTSNPKPSAQDRHSKEMKGSGEAKERSNDESKDRSADAQAGEKSHQQAQTPRSNDKSQSSGAANNKRDEHSAQTPAVNSDHNARTSSERTSDQTEAKGANGHAHRERLSASLKAPEKTRLTRAFEKIKVQPVTHVDFSVSVGTEVPRTVVLHPVPEAIVDVIPEYRDYDFFVVREDLVIVEPRTHKIVDVIERHGAARAETHSTTHGKVKLSAKDRRRIHHWSRERNTATTGAASRETRIIVGEDAPEAVQIEPFPEDVYREVPAVRSYRYIHSGSNVYLVEPNSRHVIEQIDEDDD